MKSRTCIANFLLDLWSHMPFLALIDENNFLAPRINDNKNDRKLRFNLINLLLGQVLVQIFSFPIRSNNTKFKLLYITSLSKNIRFNISDEKEKQLERQYHEHLKKLKDKDIEVEKEALIRKLENAESRIEYSYTKINVYTSVVLVLIPLLFTTFIEQFKRINSLKEIIVLTLLVYSFINLCILIFQAIRVRDFKMSSFMDLKNSEDKANELNWQIYYDWQQTNKKADMFVSFVSYCQEWIIGIMFFTVVLFGEIMYINPPEVYVNQGTVYTIDITSIDDVYTDSAYSWHKILTELHSDKYERVIVLKNNKDLNAIERYLEKFKNQEAIYLEDRTLSQNEIKIILED